MKGLFFIALFFSCFDVMSNNETLDTIAGKTFELVDQKIPKQYKKTAFDSISIVESQNLSELIQQHSSVFIKDYGPSSLSSISFRGTGASHTQVQWNGVLLNSPMNGQVDFSLYPTIFFNQAELHHGAASLMGRNGALGGSVLLKNSQNFEAKNTAFIKQTLGSFGAYKTELSTCFIQNKWLFETQLFYYTAQNNFEFKNISKKGTPIEQQKNAEMSQYGIQQGIYKQLKNGSFGGRIWLFDSDRNLAPTITKDSANENQKDQSFRALLEYKQVKNKLSFTITSGLVKDVLIYEDMSAKIYSKSNSYLVDNLINTTYYINNNINIINNLNIRFETAESGGYSTIKERTQGSWMTGVVFNLGRVQLNVFNRFIALNNVFNPLAPSVGGKIQLLKKEQLYFKTNAGINYHYPSLNDLYWNPGGNDSLKPEKAQMIEAGFSYTKNIRNTELTLGAVGFYNYVSNWIIWLPTEFSYWSPTNLKEVENKGFEATFGLNTTFGKLTIKHNANYAYTASTNIKTNNELDNSINKQLIYVPFHKFNYTFSAKYKNTSVYYNYSYTGMRFVSTDNNWYMPAYFIHNVSISQQIKFKKVKLTASFKANNLLNQDYQAMAFRAMPGRNFLFSISLGL
ncbi:MAG: TonB-dependent receptor [Bacteroidetes bacterium]|nr:TonB-dependent receptor [Bacteroidota bacterium]